MFFLTKEIDRFKNTLNVKISFFWNLLEQGIDATFIRCTNRALFKFTLRVAVTFREEIG